MNSRREYREIMNTCGESSTLQVLLPKFFRTLRLFILILLFSQNAFAQKNIVQQEYDINDPRNPNCPCHKYQQMANDEYEQTKRNLQGNQFAINTGNFNPPDNNNSDNSSSESDRSFSSKRSDVSAGSGTSYKRVKKKKPGVWFRKKINRTKLKNTRIKKVRPNYSVCYKW